MERLILQTLIRVEQLLIVIIQEGEYEMSALQALQQADQDLKDEVTAFLANIAGRLSGGASETEVQQIADDVNAEVAALRAGDPGATQQPPAGAGPTVLTEPSPVVDAGA